MYVCYSTSVNEKSYIKKYLYIQDSEFQLKDWKS